MPAPVNRLKQRLAAGETTHGLWLGLADPYLAEIAATARFDWLLLDGEHAPNDIRSLSAQIGVLQNGPSDIVLRLPDDDPAKIKQALDIGAQTLLVPMIESAAQAQRALAACHYPPNGLRGVGSALARASRFAEIPDYLNTADAQICLIVQVESRAGLAALEDILQIEGLDAVFIGPSDLAADMGHLGNPGHPQVRQAVLEALDRISRSGKAAGVLSTDPEFIQACTQAGARFVGVGIDVTVFAHALRQLAARYRNSAESTR
ncbi:HpcH/HpaI aldolase/citrate lyase family protein [Thioclava sp. GXIMD4215]|uniref:HpcH/HpaI aldolase/citrate lyase family protein n=1 Tax=Thioclava sp. GXIMD4215 TaxID=3131928 RepID=UPI00311B2EA8